MQSPVAHLLFIRFNNQRVLSCLWTFQRQLQQSDCQNALMKKVFDTHMLFLQINQSAAALKHVFAALRLFVGKVTMVLFC